MTTIPTAAPPASTRPAAAVTVACLALFTDMFVYGLAVPVLPLLRSTQEAGPSASGLLFASYAAAMIIATPVAGRMVDRHGPRQPLLVGMTGLAGASLLFATGGPYPLLLLGRSLQGLAAGMSWVAGLSLIAAVVPIARRGVYLGGAMGMVSMGVLLGPPLSGLIVEHQGTAAPFVLAAVLALADGALRILLVKPAPAATDDPAGPLAVLRVPGSLPLITLIGISAGTIAAIEPVLPVQLTRTFRWGSLEIGLLFGLTVLVGAVLGPVAGSLLPRLGARPLMGAGSIAASAGLALVAVGQRPSTVIAGMSALGAAVACLSAPSATLIGHQGQRTTPRALGGAYTLFNLAYATGLMLGPALAGPLTDALGFTRALQALAAAVAVAGVSAVLRTPDPFSAAVPLDQCGPDAPDGEAAAGR